DPDPPALKLPGTRAPADADALREQVAAAMKKLRRQLDAADLSRRQAAAGGERWLRNSVAGQRRAQFFEGVRKQLAKWITAGKFPKRQRTAALRAIRELEDEATIGVTSFDDHDTGTYHSFGHDEPFVHYLEALLEGLPTEGSEAMAVLGGDAQLSVRRQRKQLQAHLDALMRSKYAFTGGVTETDVERTVGGILIDRETRMPVSLAPDGDPFAPTYQLLRIDPAADHEHAGAWVWRDDGGRLHLEDGKLVRVPDSSVRAAKKSTEALTFLRAPDDPRLRAKMPLDWDEDGLVQADPIEWVSWAGHCDVKAVMESLGLVLDGAPRLQEHRCDTGKTQVFDRKLLLEMVASVVELGSDYRSLDGTDEGEQGETAFGGARNDSRPDRLAFSTSARPLQWPGDGEADAFVVESLQLADGERADLDRVFLRWAADLRALDFAPNPRFVRTVDDDMSEIDVTGAKIGARIAYHDFDRRSGALVRKSGRVTLDLGARSGAPVLLGTIVEDPDTRELSRVFYDPKGAALVFRSETLVAERGTWKVREHGSRRVALARSRKCTLAREQRRDDPAMYRALLDDALRKGRPICADTDAQAPVWNGMVTKLDVRKLGANAAARVEHWRVEVTARFGEAALEYLLRRDEHGEPIEACPLSGRRDEQWPDFLWSELPDIASKALIQRRWMVNTTMYERGIVTVESDRSVEGGFYVHDDHIKHVLELIYCVLSGHHWTIVLDGKRYGFTSAAKWKAAVTRVQKLRRKLRFTE
ncbi:MAG TPA: hypothetical protein VG755_07080, partial [Nannocystaceae bacterium]|nr:hypothetical protein [Nannocystaceae bacterium]